MEVGTRVNNYLGINIATVIVMSEAEYFHRHES